MKFTCSQAALLKAINTCSKAVSVRTTIPILKGILLEVKEGYLTLSASDLDISIETTIDVQNAENGSSVVSSKLFGEMVLKCNEKNDYGWKKNHAEKNYYCMIPNGIYHLKIDLWKDVNVEE